MITSVYDVTPETGGVLATTASPECIEAGLGLDAVGEQLVDRVGGGDRRGWRSNVHPECRHRSDHPRVGTGIVLDVETGIAESAGQIR